MARVVRAVASLVRAACVAARSYAGAQPIPADGEWPSYGGANWSRKYSPLDRMDAANFGDSRAGSP